MEKDVKHEGPGKAPQNPEKAVAKDAPSFYTAPEIPGAKPFRGQSVVISDNPERDYVVEVFMDLETATATSVSKRTFKVHEYEEYRQYVLALLGAGTP